MACHPPRNLSWTRCPCWRPTLRISFVSCLLRCGLCLTRKVRLVVEYSVMRRFVSALTVRGLLHSAIWLHDGFWCSPIPPEDTVLFCAKEALDHYGLYSGGQFLKIESLHSNYMDLHNHFASSPLSISKQFSSLRSASLPHWARHTVMFGQLSNLTRDDGRRTYATRKRTRKRFARGSFRGVLNFYSAHLRVGFLFFGANPPTPPPSSSSPPPPPSPQHHHHHITHVHRHIMHISNISNMPRFLSVWQAQYPEPLEGVAARGVAAGPPVSVCG